VAAVAVAAVVLATSIGRKPSADAGVPAAGSQAAAAPEKKNPEITIIPIDPPPAPQKGSGDEIEMPSMQVGSADRPRPPRPPRPPDRGDPKKDPDKKDLSRDLVAAKFSSARREYAAFKGRNGDRLEKEWGDLATFMTYQLTSANLEDAARRIETFRAKLRE
jgi:hypothetical protein